MSPNHFKAIPDSEHSEPSRARLASRGMLAVFAVLLAAGCGGGGGGTAGGASGEDPAEVVVGERLFLETRFAQFFAANFAGDVNDAAGIADPTLDAVATTGAPLVGPFAGRTMNCRQCHFVDDAAGTPGGRSLTYGDFARRSPVPTRSDGQFVAARNAPPLVNASLPRAGAVLLHFDGEFADAAGLIKGTLTGRNFGWLPGEEAAAVAHVARVIRDDDGSDLFADVTGGLSYRRLFAADPLVPAELRLPKELRLDVMTATDAEIFDAVAKVMSAYVGSLEFARNEAGAFDGSPFDAFLAANALPRRPDPGETDLAYQRRLRSLLPNLAPPVFVTPADGELLLHDGQPFEFGAFELLGLVIFLTEPSAVPPTPGEITAGGVGNCLACHQGPQFTDFLVHNVGVAQEEFDALHGAGAFSALAVPNLAARGPLEDLLLPATAAHPLRAGLFRAVPNMVEPTATDLGAWSVFANADFPAAQAPLREVLAAANGLDPNLATTSQLLDLAVATFKTPGLRSLGQCAPYFHTGRFDTLESVAAHYRTFSAAARAGSVRNADTRLAGVALTPADDAPLAAFLRSLNEDYQ